jgi:hypothetical protein
MMTPSAEREGTVKRVVTITLLVLMAGFLGYAGVKAPQSVAFRNTCHSTVITLKSNSTVTARKSLKLTLSTAQTLGDHGLYVTLQYRKSTSSTWRISGVQMMMSATPWPLRWRAPKTKGKYKLRVKVEWSDEVGTETTYSNVKTVRVN